MSDIDISSANPNAPDDGSSGGSSTMWIIVILVIVFIFAAIVIIGFIILLIWKPFSGGGSANGEACSGPGDCQSGNCSVGTGSTQGYCQASGNTTGQTNSVCNFSSGKPTCNFGLSCLDSSGNPVSGSTSGTCQVVNPSGNLGSACTSDAQCGANLHCSTTTPDGFIQPCLLGTTPPLNSGFCQITQRENGQFGSYCNLTQSLGCDGLMDCVNNRCTISRTFPVPVTSGSNNTPIWTSMVHNYNCSDDTGSNYCYQLNNNSGTAIGCVKPLDCMGVGWALVNFNVLPVNWFGNVYTSCSNCTSTYNLGSCPNGVPYCPGSCSGGTANYNAGYGSVSALPAIPAVRTIQGKNVPGVMFWFDYLDVAGIPITLYPGLGGQVKSVNSTTVNNLLYISNTTNPATEWILIVVNPNNSITVNKYPITANAGDVIQNLIDNYN